MHRNLLGLAGLVALSACAAAPGKDAGPASVAAPALAHAAAPAAVPMAAVAVAVMRGVDGADHGRVILRATGSGRVVLRAELRKLPPGAHGFHLHTIGACDAATRFDSAGGHLAAGKAHGVTAADGPHPGDFPNLHVPADGSITVELFLDSAVLGDGPAGAFDADGAAVMIHANPDDYVSQPAGNAGPRIACGVVERSPEP